MPWKQAFSKFKSGTLHSGSKAGPVVRNRRQAVAIALSEKRQADDGDEEYASGKDRLRKVMRGGS